MQCFLQKMMLEIFIFYVQGHIKIIYTLLPMSGIFIHKHLKSMYYTKHNELHACIF